MRKICIKNLNMLKNRVFALQASTIIIVAGKLINLFHNLNTNTISDISKQGIKPYGNQITGSLLITYKQTSDVVFINRVYIFLFSFIYNCVML